MRTVNPRPLISTPLDFGLMADAATRAPNTGCAELRTCGIGDRQGGLKQVCSSR